MTFAVLLPHQRFITSLIYHILSKLSSKYFKRLNKNCKKKTTTPVVEISQSSNEQATGISQIDKGIRVVSNFVQTNSATAVQSAAASE
jgi:methyl-accepting chemotaxis protein